MGYAIAESAINHNHEVILVSGPVSLEPPQNCKIIKVETAAQMYPRGFAAQMYPRGSEAFPSWASSLTPEATTGREHWYMWGKL